MNKVFYDAGDIAADLSIPRPDAERLLEELCSRMEQGGLYTIKGMVPKAYYEKQKDGGFLLDARKAAAKMPANEKRLLSIGEFCEYAGGIGAYTARKHIKGIGAEVRIGGRCLVDREKFDRWCDGGDGTL